MKKLGIATALTLSLVMGCVAVDPDPALDTVRELGNDRFPADVVWVRSEEDQALVDKRVGEYLEQGLTRDEAVRIAVLNSPIVQAQLAELGVATADVVEAGLPTNPTLDFVFAFPMSAGNSGASLVGWLSDIWMLPRRKKVAEMGARQAEFLVTRDIMVVAQEAARTWDELVTARKDVELHRKLLVSREAALKRHRIRFSHGIDDEAVVQEAATMAAEQQVVTYEIEQMLTEAVTQLAHILNVRDAAGYVAGDIALPIAADPGMTIEEALTLALDRRLDLALAQAQVERRSRVLGLEKAMVWRSVAVGANYEGTFKEVLKNDNTLGAVVSIELPIFNQNQAGKAAADYRLQQAIDELEEAQLMTAKEVVDLYQGFVRARSSLDALEKRMLPAAQTKLEYVKGWNARMQLSYVEVLVAEQALLDARIRVVDARKGLNESSRRLHMALHGG